MTDIQQSSSPHHLNPSPLPEDETLGLLSDTAVTSFMKLRHVRVVLLDYASKERRMERVLIHENSTFEDIEKTLGIGQWTILEATYGPKPCWSRASPQHPVAETAQTLYAIRRFLQAEIPLNYILGVVRKVDTDYPIAIFQSSSFTISMAVVLADPTLENVRIAVCDYSDPLQTDIGGEPYNYHIWSQRESQHPTAFIVTVGEPPIEFSLELPPENTPPFLQMTFLDSKHLLERSYDIEHFSLQMIHLSRALLHAVVSLAEVFRKFEPSLKATGRGGHLDEDSEDFLLVAPLLAGELEKFLNELRKIVETTALHDSHTLTNTRKRTLTNTRNSIHQLFHALCGEHPGAVAIRHSAKFFYELEDLEDHDVPDLSGAETKYPDAELRHTEIQAQHSVDEGQDSTDESDQDSPDAPLGTRCIDVMLLDRESQTCLSGIMAHEMTTYGDIGKHLKKDVFRKTLTDLVALRAIYGPRTCWVEADLDSPLEETCQTLHFVDKSQATRYALATVRTAASDRPLAIFDSPSDVPVTIHQAIIAADPALAKELKHVYSYSDDTDMGETSYQYDLLKKTETSSFPTVLFIVVSEPPKKLIIDSSESLIPPFLQLPLLHSSRLMESAYKLQKFPLQMIHLSKAISHVIISLADGLGPALKSSGNGEGEYLASRRLLEIASPLVCNLRKVLVKMDRLIEDIQGGVENEAVLQADIDRVFIDLCAEHPGCQTIRSSHEFFKGLAHIDHGGKPWVGMGRPADPSRLAPVRHPHDGGGIISGPSQDPRGWVSTEALEEETSAPVISGPGDGIDYIETGGGIHVGGGEVDLPLSLQNEALDFRKRVLGERHPDTITAMSNLAVSLSDRGRFEDAEKLRNEVLDLRKEVLGERHPDTITAMSNLAVSLSDRGRFEDAEKLRNEVLDLRKEVLGERHPDTITAMSNLAVSLSDRGRFEDAEKLQNEVLDLRKEILGERHPDTITAMSNLAVSLRNRGRLEDAEKLQNEVLDLRKEVLGERHPDTITAMSNLAVFLRNRGRLEDAEKLQNEVLDLRKEVLGERHPDTITAMSNLAVSLSDRGRFEDAEKLRNEVLDLRKEILGERHPDTITAMSNLAVSLSDRGRLEDAGSLQNEVYTFAERFLGGVIPTPSRR